MRLALEVANQDAVEVVITLRGTIKEFRELVGQMKSAEWPASDFRTQFESAIYDRIQQTAYGREVKS